MLRLSFAALLVIGSSLVHAGDADKAAAKLRSPLGTLLQKGPDKNWKTPALYDSVPADVDLVALPGARGILEIKEGDVRLILAGNLPELHSSPTLEAAIRLHQPTGHDLDFTLDRGRVIIENHKETGPAKVRIRVGDKHFEVELLNNTATVAVELYSRWPAGAPFLKKPKADHLPVGELILMVLKGKAEMTFGKDKQTLQGPVYYRFSTLRGMEGPLPLNKMPEWLQPGADKSDKAKTYHAAVEKLRRSVADLGAVKGIAAAVKDEKNPALREVAAYSALALEDLAAGVAALQDPASKEVRGAATLGLLHFAGRGAAEDIKLYETLVGNNFKAGQAGIVMELLHGFNQQARSRPETYDALITYLQSDQIAVRELAAWNLYRLVQQGKVIDYDAGASSEQRAAAQAAWRKLIPEGQVPGAK